MRVLLIAGGWSDERDVSLNGAVQIQDALISLGHEVCFFDLDSDLSRLIKEARKCNVAFINLHGRPGEDGTVQALLDDIGLPYQGSGTVGSFLALNKYLSKQIFRNHGLPTPDWFLLTGSNQKVPEEMNFPLVAKPNTGGSSLGMTILKDFESLDKYIKQTISKKDEVILEEYIQGQELTCAVLGDSALPPILIKPLKGFFFDYVSKYDPDGASEICPAPVSAVITEQVQSLSLEVHDILGLEHYSRTDFILDKNDNIFILEANTLPGMTKTSLVPKAALAAGLDFKALVGRLLAMAIDSGKNKLRADNE